MKDFIFVSDFDGTLTRKDFYQILIDNCLNGKANESFISWREGNKTVFDFLNNIFTSINCTEEEIFGFIKQIDFDNSSIPVINKVKENNGDFVILSAGSSYYIEKLLEIKGICGVEVVSNKAVYKDGGIHMVTDENSPIYSKSSGIDKEKVVLNYKKQYKKIYYAGDGVPDFKAAQHADKIFARLDLKDMLLERNIEFTEFKSFYDINNQI